MVAAGLCVVAVVCGGKSAQASSTAPPCVDGFPGAHAKTVGKTTVWNRQDSVRYIVCDGFGLKPSSGIEPSAAFVCDMAAIAIGKTDEVEGFKAESACDAYEIEKDPKAAATYVGILCGWAADALGLARKQLGTLADTGCALAPVIGTNLGGMLESNHELDVDRDILTSGKCLKYSPTHFGSPWVAVACAKNDPGFSPLATPAVTWSGYRGVTFGETLKAAAGKLHGTIKSDEPRDNANLFFYPGDSSVYLYPSLRDNIRSGTIVGSFESALGIGSASGGEGVMYPLGTHVGESLAAFKRALGPGARPEIPEHNAGVGYYLVGPNGRTLWGYGSHGGPIGNIGLASSLATARYDWGYEG
jgi:hypothetical protein